ncbi:MAG TPA: glycosyltransferase family 39 protein [Candidatus Obscuribacterales bacterium]
MMQEPAKLAAIREALIPVALFAGTALSRIPFASDKWFLVDSAGFCRGALTTLVSHPPGYIGYCVLGRLAHYLTHDINSAFVLVNTLSTALATVLLYFLGREMFGKAQGVIAAILYAASLNTWYNSEVALSYPVEGLITAAFALTGWKAVQLKSWRWLVPCTLVIGVSGAVRITTLPFLFLLWLYVLWKSSLRLPVLIGMTALLAATVTSWMIPQAMIMDRVMGKATMSSLYEMQGAVTLVYDRAALPGAQQFEQKRRFLWPGLELAVAAWNKISPPPESAREEVKNASLSHGLAHLRTQVAKLIFYTIWSGGLASLLWLLPIVSRSVRQSFVLREHSIAFLALWIMPACLFFAFGHFGPWGFLHVYLGALCLIAANSLVSFVAATSMTEQKRRQACLAVVLLSAGANAVFFTCAAPLPETSDRSNLLNLLVLQYTAPAIKQHFARSRAGTGYVQPQMP